MNKYLLFLIILTFLFSCKEEEKQEFVNLDQSSVLVLNEGNFRSANGSVSIYNPIDKQVVNEVFRANNSGRPLGDVVQSMVEIDGKGFIVVNNSNKIEVVDLATFQAVGQILNLNSPRYVLPINSTKAYVSDLYEDKIYIINPQAMTITGAINTKGWTEEMVLVNNTAFVCQVDSNQVYVIDVLSDSIVRRINVNTSPSSIVADKNDNVWVACTGGNGIGNSALIRINSASLVVDKRLENSDINQGLGQLRINSTKDELFYLSDGLHKISVNDTALSVSPMISANNRLFYGLGINSANDDIYITDAIDYQQRGVVYRFDKSGVEVDNFKVGLIPQQLFFK